MRTQLFVKKMPSLMKRALFARGDFSLLSPTEPAQSITARVLSGAATTINAGEPTKSTTVGSVVIMVDGDGTTSQKFAGIAKSDSSDTASANGTVQLWLPLPGYIYKGRALTATAVDTDAEIAALVLKRVVFDLTGSAWTVDTAASNSATNGVVIVGGDSRDSSVYWMVSPQCTILDNPTTA